MNCRVTYRLRVDGFEESRGSFIVRNVVSTAEAGLRAVEHFRPALAHLPKETIKEAMQLTIQRLPDDVPESAAAAVNALRCHVWPLLAVWWLDAMMDVDMLGKCLVALAIAAVLLGVLVLLKGAEKGYKQELPVLPLPKSSMSEEERERLLLQLLDSWQRDAGPYLDVVLERRLGLTSGQIAGFMHWARGQVRDHGDRRWMCVVERGSHSRWLRFKQVSMTQHHWPQVAAEEEVS